MNTSTASRTLPLAVAAVILALAAVGCTTQKAKSTNEAPPAVTQTDRAGYRTTSAYFPTGSAQSSVLLVEETVPTEVLVGQPFDVVYKLTNLSDLTLQDVTLTADGAANFRGESASPEPDKLGDQNAVWMLGDLPPRQSREIQVRGSAVSAGVIAGCVGVTFRPVLCDTVKVLEPAIELVKTMPPQVIQCDPIPVRLVVRNKGTSALTNVRVTDSLPTGLATDAGQTAVAFDAGTLAPGESKEFTFNAAASKTGKFTNPARVTSAQGVEASAEASVMVTKPVLTIECQTPAMKELVSLNQKYTEFVGRPFSVCWEVKNTGDAPAANTLVAYALAKELDLISATDGGALDAVKGNVIWNLGTLAPGASKKVCATLVGKVGGDFRLSALTRGACAEDAGTGCNIFIQGVNAILVEVVDDPDPIQVGEETTYTVRVTNQGGGLDLQDVAVKANFPEGLVPGAASGGAQVSGQTVTWPVVSALPNKQSITYTVKGKGSKAGDNRLEVEVTTKGRQTPIVELESTTVY